MNDKSIEQEIQAKGLTAPRVTPADLQANIVSEHYFTAGDGYAGAAALDVAEGGLISPPPQLDLLTFCVLILKNGFTVTGESACASPDNFDVEIGRKRARDNAVEKVWPLMGCELKERLYQQALPAQSPVE
nr:Gp49 family protein [Pseudomonas fuscovaginae]